MRLAFTGGGPLDGLEIDCQAQRCRQGFKWEHEDSKTGTRSIYMVFRQKGKPAEASFVRFLPKKRGWKRA